MFEVNIKKFIPGSKHTFQLVAKLKSRIYKSSKTKIILLRIDGKETYRSDLMEFIVPDLTSNSEEEEEEEEEVECITVSNDLPPRDLPGRKNCLH